MITVILERIIYNTATNWVFVKEKKSSTSISLAWEMALRLSRTKKNKAAGQSQPSVAWGEKRHGSL